MCHTKSVVLCGESGERDPQKFKCRSRKDGNVCRINVNQQKEFLLGGSRSLSELFQSISFPWSWFHPSLWFSDPCSSLFWVSSPSLFYSQTALHLDALIFGFSSSFRFMNHLPYFHIKKSWDLPYVCGGKSLSGKVKQKILIFTQRILERVRWADSRS